MRSSFPLFQSHIDLAHRFWKELLVPGDTAIDATCGNGHDSLMLAQSIQPHGNLYLIDIQKTAIEKSSELLSENLNSSAFKRVHFIHGCHSAFPKEILPGSVRLIVYNLGYLPGGDKTLTTAVESTKKSLISALELLMPSGAISITCYSGHAAGKLEEDTILAWSQTLDPKQWSCSWHSWRNRRASPSLLLIQAMI